MKWLLFLLAVSSAALAQDRRVADYYLNDPEPNVGRKITLNCAYVVRRTTSANPEYVLFEAYTMSRSDANTAYIRVRVAPEDASAFAKKYGADYSYNNSGYEVRTRPLSGIFTQGDGGYYLAYTPSS